MMQMNSWYSGYVNYFKNANVASLHLVAKVRCVKFTQVHARSLNNFQLDLDQVR